MNVASDLVAGIRRSIDHVWQVHGVEIPLNRVGSCWSKSGGEVINAKTVRDHLNVSLHIGHALIDFKD